MASPGTFTAGQVLTAAEMNALPGGLVAGQTWTTSFTTTATHTTFQDTGATLTFDEISGRVYRHSVRFNPFPSGGVQSMEFRILRAGVVVTSFALPQAALQTDVALPFCVSFWYTSAASGSVTWKWQLKAITANTAVSDYGDSTYFRQYAVEDVQQ